MGEENTPIRVAEGTCINSNRRWLRQFKDPVGCMHMSHATENDASILVDRSGRNPGRA